MAKSVFYDDDKDVTYPNVSSREEYMAKHAEEAKPEVKVEEKVKKNG